MEAELQKLNNSLSKKQRIPIRVKTTSSDTTIRFTNEINLKNECDYEMGLYYFDGTNGIFNISEANNNNNFAYFNGTVYKIIKIPDGGYEISELNNKIQEIMKANNDYTAPSTYYIEIGVERPTLRTYIKLSNNYAIDFSSYPSFHKILGFEPKVYETDGKTYSPNAADITDVDSLNITCNITSGFYDNGQNSNLIFSYPIPVPIGYTFRIVPSTIIYSPVTIRSFKEINFRIVNDDGKLIDFNGYTIKFVLLIRQV